MRYSVISKDIDDFIGQKKWQIRRQNFNKFRTGSSSIVDLKIKFMAEGSATSKQFHYLISYDEASFDTRCSMIWILW